MAQGLPSRHAANGSDRDHVTATTLRRDRIEVGAFILLLILLALLAGPAAAQSRGQVQVAARVVLAEPSRTALDLGTRSTAPGSRTYRSSLARIRVTREPAERRVIAIDFLRN